MNKTILNSVCVSYRHDFGLLSEEEQEQLRYQAEEWFKAWSKEISYIVM